MATTRARSGARQRKVLYIALGSDCDPDRASYGGAPYDSHGDLRWEGLREGVVKARQITREVGEGLSVPTRITWCVRSDAQMKEVYGDYAWPYKAFSDLWEDLADGGDEIAWHPHLWRWDDTAGCWHQEIEDEPWITDCLGDGYEALRAMVGETLVTSRMGWEFHTNHTMQMMAGLGVAYDFSAIPGWFAAGEASRGSRFHCYADWRGTPQQPYVPSRADYRRPACHGEDPLSITEFPMSTFASRLWGGLRAIRKAVRSSGPRGISRAICPATWQRMQIKAYATIKPGIFNRLLAATLQKLRKKTQTHGLLVTAFHPDELLEDGRDELYSSTNFEANLRSIISHARELDVEPVFVAIPELGDIHAAQVAGSHCAIEAESAKQPVLLQHPPSPL